MDTCGEAVAYLQTVWGGSRPDAFLEISARVNGVAGTKAAREKKSLWKSQHVRLGDLLNGGRDAVEPLIRLGLGEKRTDLYVGCMPLSAAPSKGRGKGSLRESVPGIWFDIDAQAPGRMESASGKPLFATPDAALEALDLFCAEKGVRAGIVTDSGWGLHAWILFGDDPSTLTGSSGGPVVEETRISELAPEKQIRKISSISPDKTAGQSAALKVGADLVELVRIWNVEFAGWAAARYGVHVDVVSDRTRVLRLPGTINWRKADNLDEAAAVKLVRCTGERYSISHLGWTDELLKRIAQEKLSRIERLSRGRYGGGSGDGAGSTALLDGVAALDACSWDEILGGFGWTRKASLSPFAANRRPRVSRAADASAARSRLLG